jgi:hypothetical protein
MSVMEYIFVGYLTITVSAVAAQMMAYHSYINRK